MPDNVLGPRVTGGSKPGKPMRRSISVFSPRTFIPDPMSEEIFGPPPIPAELLSDFETIRMAMVDKPAELDEYDGEAWMTPEQVAVLNDLRAECG